ncbi:MAG: oxidoreductase [Oscillospiraceae bacterium]|nr:oxidoreductase [Oscillospiraceae bacterium]
MAESCALHQRSFAPSGLHYVSAAHGGWGVVRIAALVPESHQLFVCPFACGRHGALGGAVNGIKDRISYLFISEADIVSGDFEQMIIDSVDELFEALEKKPKVLFIFTSCLDDLLGTDHEPILAELSEKYRDVKFRHCTMNPIKQDTPLPPGVTCNINMFSLLEKSGIKRKMVNVMGSNVSYSEESDLKKILGKYGYTVSNISDYKTFEDFQNMSTAELNIVASPIALRAAQMLEKKLGIPYIKAYVNYMPELIENFYKELSDKLGIDFSDDIKEYKEQAEKKIKEVSDIVGDYPVAVDYQAVLKPYSLALMLVRNGFNVKMIASDGIAEHEKPALEALTQESPDILLENPLGHDAVKFEHEGNMHLCIGFDCGYMTASQKVVNIIEDEGMFGYYGIVRLMELMKDAYNSDADVNEIISKAGLII